MTNGAPENHAAEAFWKRGWFVGGLSAVTLLVTGALLGISVGNDSSANTTIMAADPEGTAGSTTDVGSLTSTTRPITTTSAHPTSTTLTSQPTTTPPVGQTWTSAEEAVSAMIQCRDVAECEVEWPSASSTAQEMPGSIVGYETSGPPETSDFRVLGDGSASVTTTFPYLLGDCATQIWTARWRSVTGESISGAVIPGTPDGLFDMPWNQAWGDPPPPSQAGFLAGFGCSQPAWTFVDSDPEFTIIADGVVEWQIWLATP